MPGHIENLGLDGFKPFFDAWDRLGLVQAAHEYNVELCAQVFAIASRQNAARRANTFDLYDKCCMGCASIGKRARRVVDRSVLRQPVHGAQYFAAAVLCAIATRCPAARLDAQLASSP